MELAFMKIIKEKEKKLNLLMEKLINIIEVKVIRKFFFFIINIY